MVKRKVKTEGSILDAINKKFGEGSLIRLGDTPVTDVEVVPTGSIGLDRALGIGGFPRGRIIEIFGKEMTAKTTLAFHVIANAQKAGIRCAFIDAEHALDLKYAQRIGVDTKELLVSQPMSGEEGLNIAEMLVISEEVGFIVIDSVAALVPQKEVDGEVGIQLPGIQARMMSQACRKLVALVATHNCSVIFINQTRMKIGVIFGNPEVTPGGTALKFYSTIRIDMKNKGKIKDKDGVQEASKLWAYVVKNKLAAPFRGANLVVKYGEGIDKWDELVEYLVELNYIKITNNRWYTFKGKKVDGKKRLLVLLKSKADYDKLAQQVQEGLNEFRESIDNVEE